MFLSFPLLSLKIEGQACSSALGVRCPSFPPAAGGMGVLVAQERARPCPARPAGARRRARGATRPVVTVPARAAVPAGGPVVTVSLRPPPGLLCEENVDDCARGPRCLNGGQCVDRIGGYSCRCLPGFAGAHCEGDINECLSSPCSSEGSLDCVQLVNDYRCVCRSAFTGERPAPRLPGGADDGDPGPVRRRPDPREASPRREKPGQPESRARLFLGPVLAPCTLQSRSTFPFLPRRVFSFVIH